jgi:hypothetical protein
MWSLMLAVCRCCSSNTKNNPSAIIRIIAGSRILVGEYFIPMFLNQIMSTALAENARRIQNDAERRYVG